MLKRFFPWRFFVKRVARKHKFLDPIALLGKLQRFAQPSEVAAPVELLRLAMTLQARGLINVQAIQHNLDWVWPYWVNKQFDPRSSSFIPRAFSITHINLTHRNWTAIGLPGRTEMPIVDPRGLITPHYDGWSVDAWILGDKEGELIPSRMDGVTQKLQTTKGLSILTEAETGHFSLRSRAEVYEHNNVPICNIQLEGKSQSQEAWLVVAIRPYNPEGVSEIGQIELEGRNAFLINGKESVHFSANPDHYLFSDYSHGDVYRKLCEERGRYSTQKLTKQKCKVGLTTAAAVFRIPKDEVKKVAIDIPLHSARKGDVSYFFDIPETAADLWKRSLAGVSELTHSDVKIQFLFDAAVKSLVLHSPKKDVFPGPYTYKHFWFRDAAYILNALMTLGLFSRAEEVIDSFSSRQTLSGHFLSQDGEWDSNGQALWAIERFCKLSGRHPKDTWWPAIEKGAKWIERKREPENLDQPHAGLFPAGFSAEHLGPNDYYYWDDFWGVQGFKSTAYLFMVKGEHEKAAYYSNLADRFMQCIEKSLRTAEVKLKSKAMPPSPYRRLDTGCIGSITVGYPLQHWGENDERVVATVDFLLENNMVKNGFFHDLSHSGVNPYLTLHIAQVLLRRGDGRFFDLMKGVADFASDTGQWPEAIHPATGGGCMGDGQHIWAAADWILMIRNCFVREECDRLILASGIVPDWLETHKELSLKNVQTPYGVISVKVNSASSEVSVSFDSQWHGECPQLEVCLPGYMPVMLEEGQTEIKFNREVDV